MNEWHPIETAPKDAEVIGWFPLHGGANAAVCLHVMHWDDDHSAKRPRPHWSVYGFMWGQTMLRAAQPTHWMPLPAAPEAIR